MDWYKNFMETCTANDIEPVKVSEGAYVLLCPKIPDKEVQKQIKTLLPLEYQIKYQESPKTSTMQLISHMFMKYGVMSLNSNLVGRKLYLQVIGHGLEEREELWSDLESFLLKDKFFESWEVLLNGQLFRQHDKHMIEEVAKNEKDRPITKDDVLNLKISLEATGSVEEFLKSLEVL